MLPISVKRRVPFTPPEWEDKEPKRIYWLRVPTPEDKAQFRCELGDRRARPILRSQLCAEMRRVIREIEPANMDETLAMLDRASAHDDFLPLPEPDLTAYTELEAMMEEGAPSVARMLASNRRFWEHMPVLAARMFLVGWASGPDGVDRLGNMDDDARGMIPEAELRAVGWHAWSLMHLSEGQRKN